MDSRVGRNLEVVVKWSLNVVSWSLYSSHGLVKQGPVVMMMAGSFGRRLKGRRGGVAASSSAVYRLANLEGSGCRSCCGIAFRGFHGA